MAALESAGDVNDCARNSALRKEVFVDASAGSPSFGRRLIKGRVVVVVVGLIANLGS